MKLQAPMTVDDDMEGLLGGKGFVMKKFETPHLVYFRAEPTRNRSGEISGCASPGHVSWMIKSDIYASLAPFSVGLRKKPIFPRAKETKGNATGKSFRSGTVVTYYTPPFVEGAKTQPVEVKLSRPPSYMSDIATYKFPRYIDTREFLNAESMTAYIRYFYERSARTHYVLHDAWHLDGAGDPVMKINRNNCVSMSLCVFVAGLYNRPIPADFLNKHKAFYGLTSYVKRHGIESIHKFVRRPAFSRDYKWVRDVKVLVRDYKNSRLSMIDG